jgi:hypothetical protein
MTTIQNPTRTSGVAWRHKTLLKSQRAGLGPPRPWSGTRMGRVTFAAVARFERANRGNLTAFWGLDPHFTARAAKIITMFGF